MTWDTQIFRDAQLRTRHIHPYFDVARETVSGWLNGHHAPGPRFAATADQLQRAVRAAILDMALPVPRRVDLSQAEHDLRIARVLHQYMQREEDASLDIDN